MAYFTLMASVAEADVDAFRRDSSLVLRPSLVSGASHLLSNGLPDQPESQFSRLLSEAVDGGELLHADLWHPLRAPLFHRPPSVRWLSEHLELQWESVKELIPDDDGGWTLAEVRRLVSVYRHAAGASECVVTALDHPGDQERARLVRFPWNPVSTA